MMLKLLKIRCYAANSIKLRRCVFPIYPAIEANGDSVTIREKPSEQGLGGAEGQDAGISIASMDSMVNCMINIS